MLDAQQQHAKATVFIFCEISSIETVWYVSQLKAFGA